MAKNQLHALLAVEQDRRNRANEIVQEAQVLFDKKADHLDGHVKTYQPLKEDAPKDEPEVKAVNTTVKEKLDYVAPFVIQAIDAQVSKEETNASGLARADVVVDGVTVAKQVAATSLLAIEQHLNRIKGLYTAIPTLDPAKQWAEDQTNAQWWVTQPEVRYRTQKLEEIVVAIQPTKEHPGQFTKLTKDIQVGRVETVYQSGKITPKAKAEVLYRIDRLIEAVKQARAKANEVEVVQTQVGANILRYINGDAQGVAQ